MPTVTWNPTDKDPNIALSNSNLTATLTTGGVNARVRATIPATSGNYFEVVVGQINDDIDLIGVQYGDQPISQYPDLGASIGWARTGYAGGPGGWAFYTGYGSGDKLGFHVKSDRIDFYKNDGYVGNYLTTLTASLFYPFLYCIQSGDNGTANFGASTIASLPTGAISWDGSQGSAAETILVNQILGSLSQALVATDDAVIVTNQTLGLLQQAAHITDNDARDAAVSQILGAVAQGATARVTAVTWNPSDKDTDITLTDGNLTASSTGAAGRVRESIPGTSGNFFEVTIGANGDAINLVGVQYGDQPIDQYPGLTTSIGWANSGYAGGPGGWASYASYGTGDKLGFHVQIGKVDLYKNDVYIGNYANSLTPTLLYPFAYFNSAASYTANFGASPIASLPIGAISWDGSQWGTSIGNIAANQVLQSLSQAVTATDVSHIAASQSLEALQQDAHLSDAAARDIAVNQILGAVVQSPILGAAATQTLDTLGQVATATRVATPPPDPRVVDRALIGTVNGTALAGTGKSGSPLVWPSSLLQANNVMFARRGMSRSGGQTISGTEQLVASATDFWAAEIRIPIRKSEQARAFRALMARADGRASEWLVPTCSNIQETVVIPGTGGGGPNVGGAFSSGFSSGFAVGASSGTSDQTVILSATTATVRTTAGMRARNLNIRMAQSYQVPKIGQYFSIGSRLYLIGSVALLVLTTGDYVITFSPGLRVAAAAGTILDFTNPRCRMRLAQDNTGDMSLDMLRFADVQMSFVEIPA